MHVLALGGRASREAKEAQAAADAALRRLSDRGRRVTTIKLPSNARTCNHRVTLV
jgi:transcription elongation GreA/GreB family factor